MTKTPPRGVLNGRAVDFFLNPLDDQSGMDGIRTDG